MSILDEALKMVGDAKPPLKPTKALVIFANGKAFALCCGPSSPDGVSGNFEIPAMDGFALDGTSAGSDPIDYEPLPDGLYVGEVDVEDDGPGDAPGSRECRLVLKNVRKATAAEWDSHCIGEWPWE